MKFYRFPHYPLTRVLNLLPDDIVVDSSGDVYIVNDKYQPIKRIKSVVRGDYTLEGSMNPGFYKLFVALTNTAINEYESSTVDG